MISAGAIVGGPEAVFFDSVLREFMQRCEHQGTWTESNIHVNIVYHLPGSTWSPDYIGVRDAKFSRKARTLMVQIAVEDEWIRGRDRVVVEDYILDAADEAICVAKTRFDRAGIEYDLESDRQFLNRCRDQTTKANKP
jgi:hypothetical protein